ncbi:MAG: hypothetical protein BGO01_20675 [Armatimonadetes bacterium 55-13]|nr:hypothetical protein [Armatimonadota bacterium]OJU64527.1 MAG: hypothetical protein BGO01_20675 [Armatimonadetes bacterium 55-13]
MTWTAQQVLRAYGRHQLPRVGRIGPKGYDNQTPGPDVNLIAWLYVVTCRGYGRCEHWLKARYVLNRENLDPYAESRIDRFESLLAVKLRESPFDPDTFEREDPRGNVRLAKISVRDAAFMAGVSMRTAQRWCVPGSKLIYEWRGKRLYVRVGELLDIIAAKEQNRYWNGNRRKSLHSKKIAS